MTQDNLIFDRALLQRRRQRTAGGAAAHDFLLDRLADDFEDRLAVIERRFPLALNLGAHHGLLSRRLRAFSEKAGAVSRESDDKSAGKSKIGAMIDMDACPALLAQCDGPRVLADEELLPFGPASLDLVVSGLSLQFVNDLPGTLAQIRRALKPDGLLLAGLIGGATLHELRDSLMCAEAEVTGGASPRVAPFADLRDLGSLLQRAGFALPVVDNDLMRVSYDNPIALMQELRAMAAGNILHERSRKFLPRAVLMRAAEIYADRYGLANGRIAATFEIITLTGWAPHESQQKPLRPGTAQARLADALGTREESAGEVAINAPSDNDTELRGEK